MPDPDQGMTIRQDCQQDLLAIRERRKKAETRGISAAEVMTKLGLGV